MNNKNENDKDVDESVELTLAMNNDKTNRIVATTNKKEFSERLSGLSDDCDVVNGVITTSQDKDDDDSKTNKEDYNIKSILPPVTDEMKDEYLLEQALKQERYADKIAASSTGMIDEGEGEGEASSSISNKCFKIIFGLSLFGIPILMWLLIIGFGIGVIIYGVISYKTYDPSQVDDPVHPPYYHDSSSPSISPSWSSP